MKMWTKSGRTIEPLYAGDGSRVGLRHAFQLEFVLGGAPQPTQQSRVECSNASVALEPHESMGQDTAAEKLVEFSLNEHG